MGLNEKNDYGNFYLKPNGVFYIKKPMAGIIETSDFRTILSAEKLKIFVSEVV